MLQRLIVLEKVKFTVKTLCQKFPQVCIGVVQDKMSAPAPPSGAGGATLEGVRVRSPRTNRRSSSTFTDSFQCL